MPLGSKAGSRSGRQVQTGTLALQPNNGFSMPGQGIAASPRRRTRARVSRVRSPSTRVRQALGSSRFQHASVTAAHALDAHRSACRRAQEIAAGFRGLSTARSSCAPTWPVSGPAQCHASANSRRRAMIRSYASLCAHPASSVIASASTGSWTSITASQSLALSIRCCGTTRAVFYKSRSQINVRTAALIARPRAG